MSQAKPKHNMFHVGCMHGHFLLLSGYLFSSYFCYVFSILSVAHLNKDTNYFDKKENVALPTGRVSSYQLDRKLVLLVMA